MYYFLDCFWKYAHLLRVLMNWRVCVGHTEHPQTLYFILASITTILLAKNKLLAEKLLQAHIWIAFVLTKLLGKHWVVKHRFSIGNLNLIASNFLLPVTNDVVLLQLQPFIISYIENDKVLKMQSAYVIIHVCFIHQSFVNLNLVQQFALFSEVVELYRLHKVVWVMVVVLVGLHKWHVALWSLNDVYRQVLQVVLVVHGDHLALYLDSILNIAIWILLIII